MDLTRRELGGDPDEVKFGGPGPYAHQQKGIVADEAISAELSDEEKPMPTVLEKLGLAFIPRVIGKVPGGKQTLEAMDRVYPHSEIASKAIAMFLPNLQENTKRLEARDTAGKITGTLEDIVRGIAEIPMGEAPEEVIKKATGYSSEDVIRIASLEKPKGQQGEIDPLTIGMLGLYGGAGKLIKPALKGSFKVLQKGSDILSNNPLAKKWDQSIDKGWSKTVNYLTVPEESILAKTQLPEQFKKVAGLPMTGVQKLLGGVRKHWQAPIERLTPGTQKLIREVKGQASMVVSDAERVGGTLARPEFSLKDRTDFWKMLGPGAHPRGVSEKAAELWRSTQLAKRRMGLDPQFEKVYNEKSSKLITQLVETPSVLNNKKTMDLIEAIDKKAPEDLWFHNGRVRLLLKETIADPSTTKAQEQAMIEMFQFPATTAELALKASRDAMKASLGRRLKLMTGPDSMIRPPGSVPPPGYVLDKGKHLSAQGNYWIHRDLQYELDSYEKIQAASKGVFNKWFTSPWKTMKIILSPAAQIRNIFTNFMLNDIGGLPVYRMDIYTEAVARLAKQDQKWKDFARLTGGGGTFSHNEIPNLETSWKYKTHWYEMGNKVLEKGAKYPKEFYNANEQVFKFAKYLHNLEKGMGKVEAATDAVIPTFNYSEITPTVAQARSHLMPFATWTTKVIPYTFEMAVKHPVRVGKWFAMYQGLQAYALEQAGISDEEWEAYKNQWPEYVKKGVYLLLPWRDSRGRLNMADLTYMVPGVGDIREMAGKGLWESVFQHPALTISQGLKSGRDFTGAPFVYDWQPAGVRAYNYLSYFMQQAMPSWFGPTGTDYKRYVKALSEQPGAMTVGQALSSQFGFKMQPLDDEQIYSLHESMNKLHMAEMSREMNKELKLAAGDPRVKAGLKDQQELMDEIVQKYQKIRQDFVMEQAGLEVPDGSYEE